MRLLFFLFLLPAIFTSAQSSHEALRSGDRFYEKKDFEAAEQAYRRAGSDAKARYNQGNAVYRQGRYADAAALYRAAAATAKSTAARADALHNLGNAHLKQRQYAQAIEAYQQALRLRPGDPDAKINLQLAQKKRQQPNPQPQIPNPQSPLPNSPSPFPSIGSEDQRNAKKYREIDRTPSRARNEKDW
ncbi:MAG: tetratricopeptide repeat protein [Saprospiraceae bacterium]